LLSVSSNGVENYIHVSRRIFEPVCSVIHYLPGAEGLDVRQIGGGCGCGCMQACVTSQLDSVRTHIARRSMDQDGLPPGGMGVVEKHLPCCDGSDRT